MLADALRRTGDLAGALEGYRGILVDAEALISKDPSLKKYLAMSHDRIGQTLDQRGEAEAALAARQFVVVAEQIARENPSVPRFRRNLGVGYENLASALGDRKDYASGIEAVHKAQDLYQALRREDAGNAQTVVDLASARNVLAELLRGSGRDDEALAAFTEALALAEGRSGGARAGRGRGRRTPQRAGSLPRLACQRGSEGTGALRRDTGKDGAKTAPGQLGSSLAPAGGAGAGHGFASLR